MMGRREGAERDWTKPRSIRVPDDIWQAARAEALRRGETISDAVLRFLCDYGIDNAVSEILDRLPLLSCEQFLQVALHDDEARKLPGYITGWSSVLRGAEETALDHVAGNPINRVDQILGALPTFRQLGREDQHRSRHAVTTAYFAEQYGSDLTTEQHQALTFAWRTVVPSPEDTAPTLRSYDSESVQDHHSVSDLRSTGSKEGGNGASVDDSESEAHS